MLYKRIAENASKVAIDIAIILAERSENSLPGSPSLLARSSLVLSIWIEVVLQGVG